MKPFSADSPAVRPSSRLQSKRGATPGLGSTLVLSQFGCDLVEWTARHIRSEICVACEPPYMIPTKWIPLSSDGLKAAPTTRTKRCHRDVGRQLRAVQCSHAAGRVEVPRCLDQDATGAAPNEGGSNPTPGRTGACRRCATVAEAQQEISGQGARDGRTGDRSSPRRRGVARRGRMRKRRLTKRPSEFREIRGDLPKPKAEAQDVMVQPPKGALGWRGWPARRSTWSKNRLSSGRLR
jgi:hypothetical protein